MTPRRCSWLLRRWRAGTTQAQLAAELGIGISTVHRAITRAIKNERRGSRWWMGGAR